MKTFTNNSPTDGKNIGISIASILEATEYLPKLCHPFAFACGRHVLEKIRHDPKIINRPAEFGLKQPAGTQILFDETLPSNVAEMRDKDGYCIQRFILTD
jgi:hypothetical protein